MSNDRYITVEISEETWRALIKLAMTDAGGMHPNIFAALLVVRGLKDWAADKESMESRLYTLAQTVLEKRETHRLLLTIAKALSDVNEDIQYEEFSLLCEQAGYAPDEILREVATDRGASALVMFKKSNKVTDAIQFLLDTMQPGKEYTVSELEHLAEKDGLTKRHLDGAKKALGIISVRNSTNWAWIIPAVPVTENVSNEH
jgi:hypothetical protein